MSLEAQIAHLHLNSLPTPVVARLLDRHDIVDLANACTFDVREIGQVQHADVSAALADAKSGDVVLLPGSDGAASISLIRSIDGNFSLQRPAGPQVTVPELSLLDRSPEVRLRGFQTLVDRARPCWPRQQAWHQVVSARALNGAEFSQVLEELCHLAAPTVASVANALRSDFAASDLVPSRSVYFESLLGPMPAGMNAAQFVSQCLTPHLKGVLLRDPSWGLRCIQATYASDLIDVNEVCAEVEDDELLHAMQAVGQGCTAFSVLATFRLAANRETKDVRFSPLAKAALDTLIRCASSPETNAAPSDTLLIALVKLSLGVVASSEEMCLSPTFWRRLASYAHAALLVETINFSNLDADSFAQWCGNQRTLAIATGEIIDCVKEPSWRPDSLSARDLWLTALIRATSGEQTATNAVSYLDIAHPDKLDALSDEMLLVTGLPDLLSGALRRPANADGPTIGMEMLTGFDVQAVSNADQATSVQFWNAVAYGSRLYSFDPILRGTLRSMAEEAAFDGTLAEDLKPAILGWIAEVASNQLDMELAEIAVKGSFSVAQTGSEDEAAALAATVIVIASGAAGSWYESLRWTEERLVALAYMVPLGPKCSHLADAIARMERFIPLQDQRWGRARVIAASAS